MATNRSALSTGVLALGALSLPAQEPGAPAVPAPVKALLVSGANNHEWQWTSKEIRTILQESGRFEVDLTEDPAKALADAKALAAYRVIVLDYNGPRWGEAAEQNFLAAVRSGTGVVVIHAANNAFDGWVEYETLVGLCWRQGTGHGAYHPFDVKVVDREHPVTRGMEDFHLHPDELYHKLVHMHGAKFQVIMDAFSDPKTGGTGNREPMATVSEFGKGRVFHTPLGHTWSNVPQSRATWKDPQLRLLVQRGTEWAATGAVSLPAKPINWLDAAERKEGFELLFNGRDFDGWEGYRMEGPPAQGWSVRDGAIVHAAGGGGGDLITESTYGDFDFRFEWRVAPKANSGVMFWVREDGGEQTYFSGPEYQVLDDLGAKPGPKHAAGALYDLYPAKADKPVRPAGQWNEGRIVISKGKLQHWLNGVMVVEGPVAGPEWDAMVAKSKFKDWPFGKVKEGHLALQDHGDEVAYRSLRIRRL